MNNFIITLPKSKVIGNKLYKENKYKIANIGLLFDKYFPSKEMPKTDKILDEEIKIDENEFKESKWLRKLFPDPYYYDKKGNEDKYPGKEELKMKEFFYRFIIYRNYLLQKINKTDKFEEYHYYKNFYECRLEFLEDICGKSNIIKFKTSSRFIPGLGGQHPTEVGLTWDRNLGVPYLPGSSVKGMVRAFAEHWVDWDKEKDKKLLPEDIIRIFGPSKTKEYDNNSEGTVIFHDAYPTKIPKLELDITNVHYKDYYEGKSPPADYLSPTPIFFLTVDKDQEFLFALGKSSVGKNEHSDEVDEDIETARDLLICALDYIGAGGKTAVGYGRFKNGDCPATENTEEEE